MKLMITIPQALFFDYVDNIEVYEEVKNKNGEVSKKRILLDVVDFVLFDYLFYVYNADEIGKIKKGNDIYVWLPHKQIIDDNPQLRIDSKSTIAKRLKKLEKFGLIKTTIYEEDGYRYFRIPSEIYEYFNTGEFNTEF